jgi:hypothetical protein
MATTTQRGYGWQHQQLRAALLASYHPEDPCWRCGHALGPWPELLDLGHVDGDKNRYAGLEHRWCSRRAGAKYGNRLRGRDGSVTRRRQRSRRGNRWRWTPDGWQPPPEEPRRSRVW